jgi:hypothetical protein
MLGNVLPDVIAVDERETAIHEISNKQRHLGKVATY